FGSEGPQPMSDLFVVNNTIVNDRPNGGTFVQIAGAVATAAVIRNNILFCPRTGTTQASAVPDHNLLITDPSFVDAPPYAYPLIPASPAVDAGTDPGTGDGQSLTPDHEYVHPANTEGRMTVGVIDIGAYELGGGIGGSGAASSSASAIGSATNATSGAAGPG